MPGMNVQTGVGIDGLEHLRQSITDILTTPIGSRVMRRNYGSHLFNLIDQAANDAGRLRLIAATADALIRWEPRIKLSKVEINANIEGETIIGITGIYNGSESSFELSVGVTG